MRSYAVRHEDGVSVGLDQPVVQHVTSVFLHFLPVADELIDVGLGSAASVVALDHELVIAREDARVVLPRYVHQYALVLLNPGRRVRPWHHDHEAEQRGRVDELPLLGRPEVFFGRPAPEDGDILGVLGRLRAAREVLVFHDAAEVRADLESPVAGLAATALGLPAVVATEAARDGAVVVADPGLLSEHLLHILDHLIHLVRTSAP
mmetsp:Transcript_101896/g.265818  ORF Transcript_101896/g.265818 Transcript_101896/m.265818 type:complete len:206 (-) Transcript_101896:701-1318(-)